MLFGRPSLPTTDGCLATLDLFRTTLFTLISPVPLLPIINFIPDPPARPLLPPLRRHPLLARPRRSLLRGHRSIRYSLRRRGCGDTTRLRMLQQLNRNSGSGSLHLRPCRITMHLHPRLDRTPRYWPLPLMLLTHYLRPLVARRLSAARQRHSCLRLTRRRCSAGSMSSRMRPRMAPLARRQRHRLGHRTLSTVLVDVVAHHLPHPRQTQCPELRLLPDQ